MLQHHSTTILIWCCRGVISIAALEWPAEGLESPGRASNMAKRRKSRPAPSGASREPARRDVVHSSLYLPNLCMRRYARPPLRSAAKSMILLLKGSVLHSESEVI